MIHEPIILSVNRINELTHLAMEYVTTLHPPYLSIKDKLLTKWSFIAKFKPNRTYLLQPGVTMEGAYYLETGLAILYSIEPKTNELKILYIWDEKSIIILCGIFKESLPPGDYYIKLIADAELVRLDDLSLDNHMDADLDLFKQKILNVMAVRVRMQTDILLMDMKSDRPQAFDKLFPNLRGRMSREQVCAFIGIKNTTLNNNK